MAQRRAELLTWLAERVAHEATACGVSADVAEQIGCAVSDGLADEWGGQIISVPKDHYYRLAARDVEILAAHRAGESLSSIALRTNMHTRSIRKIIARAALRDPSRQQPRLFD
jgi:Mor family transcriptional regulator